MVHNCSDLSLCKLMITRTIYSALLTYVNHTNSCSANCVFSCVVTGNVRLSKEISSMREGHREEEAAARKKKIKAEGNLFLGQ
jgi:hypothetical protein